MNRTFLPLVLAGLAVPASAPVEPDAVDPYTGVARTDVGERCTAALIDTGVDTAPAYLLTNGHCGGSLGVGANEVVVDAPASGTAVFAPLAGAPDGIHTASISAVPYSTMKGLDVSILRTDMTLGDARAAGLRPLPIAAKTPSAGDTVVNVGIPMQGLPETDWVLRRGECTLGEQIDLIEFVWHFDGSWANDCPGIRGSSGSPVLDASGRIVAMINTTTGGAPPGGDCYLGKPCERTAGGVNVVADRSYAVPVAGIDRCFDAGLFALEAPGCVLDPGGGVTARIDQRAVQPLAGGEEATTTATIDGPPGITFAKKVGPAGDVDCGDEVGYGTPTPLEGQQVIDVTVPGGDGFFLLCVAEPGREARAAVSVIQVDGTPPQLVPELSVRHFGETVAVEPIFAVPELSDFRLKVGPTDATDCDDDAGYVRYRRIPLQVASDELPVTVCVVGSDEAGNDGVPYSAVITPEDR